jgi:anti-sigma factor RsiW
MTQARLLEEKLRRRRMPWAAIAAMIAAFAAGGAGGWLLGSRPLGGINALTQEAAANYAVYVVDRNPPVEMSGSQQSDLRRWISNRLGRPGVVQDLTAVGYELLGGRLVPSPHGPAAFLMYQSATGTRMTIYLRPMPGRAPHPIEQINADAIDGCAWVDRCI